MKKTKIAIAGLGRLGNEHARNLKFRIPNADLIAVCSMAKQELAIAKEELEIESTYTCFDEMLEHPGLEALCIATSSNTHADFIIKALEKGKHVFCEKPLALSEEDCYRVLDVAKTKPELALTIGFNRRFDNSYYQAWKHIQSGLIGKPFMVYNQTADMDNTATFQIQFSKTGGGFIVDANIHDVDVAQWLLNSRIISVTAVGGAYAYPDFAKYDDVDNILILAKTENGSSAIIGGSRTMFHGHYTWGFVRGTKGELAIGRKPQENSVEILDQHGVRYECVQTFYDRFKESFYHELEDFINCVQNQQPVRVNLQEAIDATRVAFACREAYVKDQTIKISYH